MKAKTHILKGKKCKTTEQMIQMFKEEDSDDKFLGFY